MGIYAVGDSAMRVAVDETRRLGAVAVAESDAALEHVGVVARVLACGVRRRQFKQGTQLVHEKLIVRSLLAAGGLPARDELVYGLFGSSRHSAHYWGIRACVNAKSGTAPRNIPGRSC